MAFTYVPVTGTFLAPGGGAATGRITFRPTGRMRNGSVTAPAMLTVYLMSGQVPTGFVVAANNDSGTTPLGLQYEVTEYIEGAAIRAYLITVPYDAGSINLATVATTPVTGGGSSVYQPLSGKGVANGYASLDSTGKVPTAQLPVGNGGATDHGDLAGLADDDHTQYLTVARGDARYYTEAEINSQMNSKSDVSHTHGSGAVVSVAGRTGTVVLTKTDVGLSSVDNTADADKPISTAEQTALNLKAPLASPAFTGTPTGITKAHVGLGNVDNTADSAKPVSTAQQTALDGKQPLDSDLTTIAGLTATTDNFMVANASAWASRTPAQAKTSLALNNVDNTSDANKPVSTATQTALDLKAALTVTNALNTRLLVVETPNVVLTDAATIAVNALLGSRFKVTIAGNRTLGNPTGAYDGQTILINVLQDGTGSRTVTLDTKYRLPTGLTITWSTTASKKDKLLVQYDSTADKFDVLAFQAGY